jgi:hypothetical protein
MTGCPLYSQFKLKALLKYWCSVYCEGDWKTCERYKRSLKGDEVPITLLPNGKTLSAQTR